MSYQLPATSHQQEATHRRATPLPRSGGGGAGGFGGQHATMRAEDPLLVAAFLLSPPASGGTGLGAIRTTGDRLSREALPVDRCDQFLRREHSVVEDEAAAVFHRDDGTLHHALFGLLC